MKTEQEIIQTALKVAELLDKEGFETFQEISALLSHIETSLMLTYAKQKLRGDF